jgi:hypothetical protein
MLPHREGLGNVNDSPSNVLSALENSSRPGLPRGTRRWRLATQVKNSLTMLA